MSGLTNPVTDNLKTRLKYAMKEKVRTQKIEFTLRSTERSLMEELSMVKSETDFMTHQLEELLQQMSGLKYQIELIEICKASEDAKIQSNISSLKQHKNGFDELFAKEKIKNRERELLRIQNQQQRQKEAEEQENDRQKQVKVLEMDEQIGIEAACIERECEEIGRECGVLTKRNRAIMQQLRRRRSLIESENTG